jgi:xylan 1,4-beta-xylosidase
VDVINRRDFLAGTGLAVAGALTNRLYAQGKAAQQAAATTVAIDMGKVSGNLPHYWEKAFGSDRTVVGLREQWRQDLVRAHKDTGMQSVRCHGLFDDEMGIAAAGSGKFNFLYVDQIYDFMLDQGVRPFVELSFMPEAFASSANRVFAYKGNTSPPRNWKDWHDMVGAFTDHCVKRYGIGEVSGWKFEVWNEPNIPFWAGTQEEYFELYRQSALAIKSVDKRLQVGGPATAQLDWIPDLIQYCVRKNMPLDFVSTHVYPNDPQRHIFGRDNLYSFEQVIPRGVAQIKNQVESSAMPHLPVWITEWSSQNPAFIADTIKNCIGLTEAMSYWTFSNVFEENGVPSGIFNSTFGLLDQWGIARPSLHSFKFLHKLGDKQLSVANGPVLATQREDGSLAIMVWNLIPAKESSALANGNPAAASAGGSGSTGKDLTLNLRLSGLAGRKQVQVSRVDDKIGSAIPAWEAMGSPKYPSQDQLKQLRIAAELPKPKLQKLAAGEPAELSITLPPNGIALLEFSK